MTKNFFCIFSVLIGFFLAGVISVQAALLIGADQSYLRQINVEPAWNQTLGRGVVVAVLDSGVDVNHPDLKNNIWINRGEIPGDGIDNDHNGYIDDVSGWDFVADSSDPSPKFDGDYLVDGINHGTAIAGIISAAPSTGFASLAPEAKIMPLRILNASGEGDVANLIKAIRYAVANGAKIINLSLVGVGQDADLEQALQAASDAGVLIITASGNTAAATGGADLDATPLYPICYQNNLGVTAVDTQNRKSVFADYGSCVDLSAPGENIKSLAYYNLRQPDFNDYYQSDYNGTSFAAAITSGAAALLKSKNNYLSPRQISQALISTVQNISLINPAYVGKIGGLLDVGAAINYSWPAVPAPAFGSLIKTAQNEIYYLDANNQKSLIPNYQIFASWYNDLPSEHKIKTVSPEELKNYSSGSTLLARSGSLLKFNGDVNIYLLGFSNRLCRVVNLAAAKNLYGQNWQRNLIFLKSDLRQQYFQDADCLIKEKMPSYPDGLLLQYANSSDIFYLADGLKRRVSSQGFSTNNFNSNSIIKNVSPAVSIASGPDLLDRETDIFPYLNKFDYVGF